MDFSALFPARRAWRRALAEAVAVGDLPRAVAVAAAAGDREALVRVAATVEAYCVMREMVRSGEVVRFPDGTYVSRQRLTNTPHHATGPEAGGGEARAAERRRGGAVEPAHGR